VLRDKIWMNAGRFGEEVEICLSYEGSNTLFNRKCEPASWMPNGAVSWKERDLKSLSGGMKLAQTAHQKQWRWHV
jgi:hypothetical protein